MKLENILFKLPFFLQGLAVNIRGHLIKKRRYGHEFDYYLKYFANSNRENINQVRLVSFLKNASETQFWNEQFSKSNVDLDFKNPLNEITKLPIITKTQVKENVKSITNTKFLNSSITAHTSGTTGSGLSFPSTKDMEAAQWAVWWRFRIEHGLTVNDWSGWFGGRSIISLHKSKRPFWHKVHSLRQIMFSTYHLNSLTVSDYVDQINKENLKWLHGYPSQITLLAHLIIEAGITPPKSVEIVTLGAENLLDHQRKVIENVFQCRVIQHYGLAEGVANISETLDGSFAPDMDFSLVEFVPISNDNNSICRIIGTGYYNDVFPLIRYDTGDLAKIDWHKGIPRILEIDGRKEDYIVLNNGVKLGRLDHIFKDLVDIKEAQIHQNQDKTVDFIVVKGTNYDENQTESKLINSINDRFGNMVEFDIIYVDTIPKSANGKLRLVTSDLK